jgi:uncharacterized membrane protein
VKEWLVLVSEQAIVVIDALALVIVVFGTVEAFVAGVRLVVTTRSGYERREIWLHYARWLVAGLTFQLAADIIETSISTSWESLVRIAVIAAIRTFLNYFLERDLSEVRERQEETTTQADAGRERSAGRPSPRR